LIRIERAPGPRRWGRILQLPQLF